jgi:hypothetical protein
VSANGVADAFVGGFLAKLCLTQRRWHLQSDWDLDINRLKEKAELLRDDIYNDLDRKASMLDRVGVNATAAARFGDEDDSSEEGVGVLGQALSVVGNVHDQIESVVDQAVMRRSENSRQKDKQLEAKIRHEADLMDKDGDGKISAEELELARQDLPRDLIDAANHAAWIVREGCFLNEEEDEEWETEYSDSDSKYSDYDLDDEEDDMIGALAENSASKLDPHDDDNAYTKKDVLFPVRERRYRFEEESVEYEEHGVLSPSEVATLRSSIVNTAVPTQIELEDIDINMLGSTDRAENREDVSTGRLGLNDRADNRARISMDDEMRTTGNWFDDQI